MQLCCSDLDVGLVLPELGGDDLSNVGGEGGAVDLGPGHLPEPRQVVPCRVSHVTVMANHSLTQTSISEFVNQFSFARLDISNITY